MRGSINISASKGDNEDNEDSWGEHDFDVGGEGGGIVGTIREVTLVRCTI